MSAADVVLSVVLLTGSGLSLLAAVGLHRFPDVFARMHAATKPATLGMLLVLGAVASQAESPGVAAKLMLVGVLQFITAPVAAHMVGRAAHLGDLMAPDTVVDELSEARGRGR